MFTKILASAVLVSVVSSLASFVPSTVATSNDRVSLATEAHGYNRLVANPSADVIRASDVTIAVPVRAIVAPAKIWTCGPMVALIQGSGSAATCEYRAPASRPASRPGAMAVGLARSERFGGESSGNVQTWAVTGAGAL